VGFRCRRGGTVTNVGIQDICPSGMCDDHDLTVVLPAPAATFYQTNDGQADHYVHLDEHGAYRPGRIPLSAPAGPTTVRVSPDDTSTGPGIEMPDLSPIPSMSLATSARSLPLAPVPTTAHALLTLTTAPRPTTPHRLPRHLGHPTYT